VEYLRAALDSVNDEVRREAVLAFRWVGVDVELKVLESQLFSSNDTELRRLILARVVELKKDGAISILESFFNDKVKELRVEAIRLAGTIVLPGTETVTKLKTLLSEADEAIRVASAAALVLIYLGAW
jgi:HEAT repeat protein